MEARTVYSSCSAVHSAHVEEDSLPSPHASPWEGAWEPSFPLRAAWNKHCPVTSAHTSWPALSSLATAGRLGNLVVNLVAVCYIQLPILGKNGRKNFGGSMSDIFRSQGQFSRGDG